MRIVYQKQPELTVGGNIHWIVDVIGRVNVVTPFLARSSYDMTIADVRLNWPDEATFGIITVEDDSPVGKTLSRLLLYGPTGKPIVCIQSFDPLTIGTIADLRRES